MKDIIRCITVLTFTFIASAVSADDRPGFVSSKTLQEKGGYALQFKASKPFIIRSVKSPHLKAGKTCDIHLGSVRQAILTGISNGSVVIPQADENPTETQISLKAVPKEGGAFECKGGGTTCFVVVTVPPENVSTDAFLEANPR